MNILILGSHLCVIIYTSYKHLEIVNFGPPCIQVAQLQGGLILAYSGRLKLWDIYVIGLCLNTVTWQQSCRIRWRKRKISRSRSLKVIQSHRGRYQLKAHMRLPI